MFNHPNMSYCAVENTEKALRQVLRLMEEHGSVEDWIDSLNEYESDEVESLLRAAGEFVDRMNTRVPA